MPNYGRGRAGAELMGDIHKEKLLNPGIFAWQRDKRLDRIGPKGLRKNVFGIRYPDIVSGFLGRFGRHGEKVLKRLRKQARTDYQNNIFASIFDKRGIGVGTLRSRTIAKQRPVETLGQVSSVQ